MNVRIRLNVWSLRERFAASFLALCLLPFGFGGCISSRDQNPENRITLEFWTLQMDAFKSTLEPMFLDYEREHPNIRIRWVDVPFSEGPKRTLTAMMSGHTPDVINLNPDFSAILANRHALLDMNRALPADRRASYLPVAWQAATLATLDQAKAQPLAFGLPWYVTSSVTLYNKELLKKAGYTTPPDSFAQLPRFAQAVRDKAHAYGLMPVITENGNFLKALQKAGIRLYNEKGRAVFDTGPAVDTLAHYVEIYQSGWIPAEAITESHQAAVGRFQAGTLATLQVGPNFLKIVKENAPEIYRETGVAPQFPKDTAMKDFALMLLVVPTKSAHPQEAVDFAAFMTNADNQLALAKAAPVLPSVTEALKNDYFQLPSSAKFHMPPDLMSQGRSISAAQLLSATVAYRIKPGQNAINEIMDHYVQLAMLGKITPPAALSRAQQEINATLE
jgi:putative chitobiose transport system substrate-binding protein